MISTSAATSGAASSVYVGVDWLHEHLDDVTILDTRGRVSTVDGPAPDEETSLYVADHDAYLHGHIPGAVFWDWTRDGVDTEATTACQLQLDPDLFAADAQSKGVSLATAVVTYDDGSSGSMLALRLRWALRLHGHRNVRVLRGGLPAWVASGAPTELAEPCPLKIMSVFEGSPTWSSYADLSTIMAALADGESLAQLLDVRAPELYSGATRRAQRGGRIPRAVNLPYKALLDQRDGALKDPVGLTEDLRAAGVDMQRPVIVYCSGGVSACVAAAALELVGCKEWKVYDGSWNEYGNTSSVRVERDGA